MNISRLSLRLEKRYWDVIPWWYGVAYYPWDRDVVVCYPVPLNFIIGVTRAFWFWMMRGWVSGSEKEIARLKQEIERLSRDA